VSEKKLKHGQWSDWVVQNLSFTIRTCQIYLKIYKYKDEIRNDGNSFLIRKTYERICNEESKKKLGKDDWFDVKKRREA